MVANPEVYEPTRMSRLRRTPRQTRGRHKIGHSGSALNFKGIVSGWCERGDLNPHGFPRQILSLVRLPIPPLSRIHCK